MSSSTTAGSIAGNIADISARYLKLYTGAISDILDKRGYRDQVLPHFITPLTAADRIAGVAYTVQGYPCADVTHDDTRKRLQILAGMTPGAIAVWATGGSTDCAHWGEIMSMAARQRGCTGAVVDGGVRDLDFINAMQYPVFARFKCAASVISRWGVADAQIPVKIGGTVIHPGDFVIGDIDGVVVVPMEITVDVLVSAEEVLRREGGMREDLRRGLPVMDAYAKYGSV